MKRKIKRMISILLISLGIVILGVFVCNLLIIRYSKPRIYNDVTSIPYNKTGLLLGTSPTLRSGMGNPYFQNRITAAVELYKAGKIKYILVSGDNHRVDYNEPEEMRKALINAGVPENVIYLDYAGFRTLDSIVRAKEIFGQESFTIISQKFHNERAVYIASWYGLDTVGYNAKDVSLSVGLKVQVRELFARVKVFIDFLFNKSPKFLGDPIELP
ncbi:MAG: YdcF family protein [Tannerellaceae bacterium]|nr:YdcF family protein [Tannerellaceae bacterium]